MLSQHKIKPGLTRKMLKGIKGRLILTRHPIIPHKLILILLETITAQNHTRMQKGNFNLNIISSHQEEIRISIHIKEGRGIKNLGLNGHKTRLKLRTRERNGSSKVNSKVDLGFQGLKAHSKVNKNLVRVQAHNLIKLGIQIGERELQEHLSVRMNLIFLMD